MGLKIILLHLVNFAMFFYFVYGHPTTSEPVKKTMLEAINSCKSVSFLQNSSYVNKCNLVSYPVELKKNPTDEKYLDLMCTTINYITNNTCKYLVADKSKVKVPETADKFDGEVKKLEPKSEDSESFIAGLCKNMTVILNKFYNFSTGSNSNIAYVKYANEALLNQKECIFTCHKLGGVNPFCMVFLWFDKLFSTLNFKNSSISSDKDSLTKSKENQYIESQNIVPQIIGDNKSEHTSIANQASVEQQSQPKLPETVVKQIVDSKVEPADIAPEQEINKNLEQSKTHEIEEKQHESKWLQSTNDKTNVVVPKVAEGVVGNINTQLQEQGNEFLLDEDLQDKKMNENGAEDENDHDNVGANKKDSFNDLGDQHSFIESPVVKEEDESHFFMYFSIISFCCVMLYIGYHNKQKVLAMVLEGRRSRRGRGSRRRPSTANYRKLDSNLEEAVTSQCNSNVTHVIY